MNTQKLLTVEQAHNKMRLQGKTYQQVAREVNDWLAAKGIKTDKPVKKYTVNAILSGHHQGNFGNAHWIAVYLGIKPECAEAYIDMPLPRRTRTAKPTTPKLRSSDQSDQPNQPL